MPRPMLRRGATRCPATARSAALAVGAPAGVDQQEHRHRKGSSRPGRRVHDVPLRNFARGTGLRTASRRPLPLETMRRRLPLLVLLLVLVVPASAQAGTFPGDPIDGPAAGLRLGRPGPRARRDRRRSRYTRPEGVFVSRFIGGKFQAPEGLGPGGAGAGAAVAAGSNGRLAVVFSSGGLVYASLKVAGDQPWRAPVLLGAGTDPAADMSINNMAYASFTQAGNVIVARLDRRTNAWALLPIPADVEPGANAGTGVLRSKRRRQRGRRRDHHLG